MKQSHNAGTSQTSASTGVSNPQILQPKTKVARGIEKFLDQVLEPIDVLGQRLLGEWWRIFYLTIQDAIALALLCKIPGLLGKLIIGKNFSSFDTCLQENALGVLRYACFIIVISDFLLWIVIAGRLLIRFWQELPNLINNN
ncbi:MAG: hypothetical protein AAFV71_01280 [Cyanobacteria bacterium J06633_8]